VWRFDVFREPHAGHDADAGTWIYRRDGRIRAYGQYGADPWLSAVSTDVI
jgi:hypothetical protein